MPLRGSTPTQEEQRLKVFIYGPPGVGKTLAALQFPHCYIIDTAKETSRYWKLIQKTQSEVFTCGDFYEVLKELEALRDEGHRFQTVVIDELTTLYQNLQRDWTDKFIKAQQERSKKKNDADNLLEDFGYRYWDKVKRDWRRLVDTLRQLDMNVVCNAHQKDKYGDNMKVVGVDSDSDKKDEYVFDYVFRLIMRGQEYRAITEKQRVLPIEIDPDGKRFPREFDWNYSNLVQFYYQEYIERPTRNSQIINNKSVQHQTESRPVNKTEEKQSYKMQSKTESKKEPVKDDIPKKEIELQTNKLEILKGLFKRDNIPGAEFKAFLHNMCKWTEINTLVDLTNKQQDILINNWNDKIIPNFKQFIKDNLSETKEVKDKKENKEKIKYEPEKPIREDQKNIILKKLSEENVSLEIFFKGYMIKSWDEINQEGANNIISNLDIMIGMFEK